MPLLPATCPAFDYGQIHVPEIVARAGECVVVSQQRLCDPAPVGRGIEWAIAERFRAGAGTLASRVSLTDHYPFPGSWERSERMWRLALRNEHVLRLIHAVSPDPQSVLVGELLARLGCSNDLTHEIMDKVETGPRRPFNTLAGTPRRLLFVLVALAQGAELVVWSAGGLDPMGMQKVAGEIRRHRNVGGVAVVWDGRWAECALPDRIVECVPAGGAAVCPMA